MKLIIKEIKSQIKSHKLIRQSALNENSKWRRAQYILLSEIFSKELSQSKYLTGDRIFELGNTISYITLQRFFEDSYKVSAVNDLRFLKTLHKFCIFLGFYDLNEFILSSSNIIGQTYDNENSDFFCDIVKNLCNTEFEIIRNLPYKSIDELFPYTFKESKTIKNIKSYIDQYIENNYYFDHEYEGAKFELISCELIADETDLKIIKTVENWDFVLKNNTGKTMYYKVFNSQTYYLKKDKNRNWKVWDNYNPNNNKIKSNYL